MGLLGGGFDEAAGVDHDDVGPIRRRCHGPPGLRQPLQHGLAVNLVPGTPQADQMDPFFLCLSHCGSNNSVTMIGLQTRTIKRKAPIGICEGNVNKNPEAGRKAGRGSR